MKEKRKIFTYKAEPKKYFTAMENCNKNNKKLSQEVEKLINKLAKNHSGRIK
jgi:hypothetical protein